MFSSCVAEISLQTPKDNLPLVDLSPTLISNGYVYVLHILGPLNP
jgi:hypothetical protein